LPSTDGTPQAEACATGALRASRLAMFRVYYLGGADYQAARRHLGISEFTWADWAEEIRRRVGGELTRAGIFPPSKYFREAAEKVS
jgi:transposase